MDINDDSEEQIYENMMDELVLSSETGNGENPYSEYYAADYKLTFKIRDLSQWKCYRHQIDHRIVCRCGQPMVEQLCGNANGETKRDLKRGFKGLWCNQCKNRIEPNQTVFRCMSGARCSQSKDGWDYCMQCMIKKIQHYRPQIRCLCGIQLILGKLSDVKQVFNNNNNKRDKVDALKIDIAKAVKSGVLQFRFPPILNQMSGVSIDDDKESSDSSPETDSDGDKAVSMSIESERSDHNKRIIKRANTYRCAWCLKKFENKQERIYYCQQQKKQCIRIMKNHLMQFQPFVVCIACAMQSDVE